MPPMNTHMINGNRTRGGLHDTKPQPHGTPVISPTGVLHTSSLSVPNGNGSVPYGIQHILNIGKSRPASLPPSFSHDESWSMSPQQSGPASSVRSWPPATGTPRERSERSHSIDSPIAAGFSYSITRWLAEGIEESREIPAMCHDRQERCNHAVTQNLENISASKKQESYRNEDTSFAGGWADDFATATAAGYEQSLEGLAIETQQGAPEDRVEESSGPMIGTGFHLPRSRGQ